MEIKMKISQRGIDFIKEAEGLELTVYDCSKGKKTIGYGHVILKNENLPGKITKEKAEKLFSIDIKIAETVINRNVKVELTQGQYDALVSLVYNWGSGNFLKSKGLKKLNRGDYIGALKEFSEVGGELLASRRSKEAVMWTEQLMPEKKTVLVIGTEKNTPTKDILRATIPTHSGKIILENVPSIPKPPNPYRIIIIGICLLILSIIIFGLYSNAKAKPLTLDVDYDVCFTPPKQCGDLIVKHIASAKHTVLMQAYAFTSKKIITALIDARKRGVSVQLILDRSNFTKTNQDKLKTLYDVGIIIYQDKVPGIAHNKVIIIDEVLVITGSFNFTESADTKNAENIIIIKSEEIALEYIMNWENREKLEVK